ncbi:Trm112 family protein [Kitasatospora sp. NPDC054939]
MPRSAEPDPRLLPLLVCPVDKGPLVHLPEEHLLYNPRLRRGYPIRDAVPHLRPHDALALDDHRHRGLLDRIEAQLTRTD